eukprot:925189-Alexandrium_andersonii.AAC.1
MCIRDRAVEEQAALMGTNACADEVAPASAPAAVISSEAVAEPVFLAAVRERLAEGVDLAPLPQKTKTGFVSAAFLKRKRCRSKK